MCSQLARYWITADPPWTRTTHPYPLPIRHGSEADRVGWCGSIVAEYFRHRYLITADSPLTRAALPDPLPIRHGSEADRVGRCGSMAGRPTRRRRVDGARPTHTSPGELLLRASWYAAVARHNHTTLAWPQEVGME